MTHHNDHDHDDHHNDQIHYEPTRTLEPFPPTGTHETNVEPAFERFLPMPVPSIIKSDYLFGLPLKSTLTGQTLSDETIERFIVQSVSEIEHSLQLFISPITINRERHNYAWQDFFYASPPNRASSEVARRPDRSGSCGMLPHRKACPQHW